jgi:hypothetical protein
MGGGGGQGHDAVDQAVLPDPRALVGQQRLGGRADLADQQAILEAAGEVGDLPREGLAGGGNHHVRGAEVGRGGLGALGGRGQLAGAQGGEAHADAERAEKLPQALVAGEHRLEDGVGHRLLILDAVAQGDGDRTGRDGDIGVTNTGAGVPVASGHDVPLWSASEVHR